MTKTLLLASALLLASSTAVASPLVDAPGPSFALGFADPAATPMAASVGASAAPEHHASRGRTIAIATNPIRTALRQPSLSVSYAPARRVAIHADAERWTTFEGFGGLHIGPDAQGSDAPRRDAEHNDEVSVGAQLYPFGRAFHGLFAEPGVMYRRSSRNSHGETTVGPQLMVGYQGTSSWGLTIAIAVGGGRDLKVDESDLRDDTKSKAFSNAYLRVGYAF